MSRVYFIQDGRDERRLTDQDMPLSIGGGQHDDIMLPGLPDPTLVAHIGLADGHAFIQPAQTEIPLFHNHEHLTASTWLKSGDRVELGDAVIHWQVQGDQVTVSVLERAAEPALVPPVIPPPPHNRSLPEVKTPTDPAQGYRTLRRVVLGVFVLLLLAVAFVLLATPIAIQVTPLPERLSVEGFPPAVTIGGRRLALPGQYTVTAEHSGYRPLRETIVSRPVASSNLIYSWRNYPGGSASNCSRMSRSGCL